MLKYIKNKTNKLATIYGTLTVKEDGTVEGLTAEQEKSFANIPGFDFEEEKKQATRKQTTATSKDKEPKEEEKKASTRKSTGTTRKTTVKKTEDK